LRYEKDRLIEVGAASVDGTHTSHRQISMYLDSGYWRTDPSIEAAEHLAGSTGISLLKIDTNQLPDNEMRSQLYGWTNVRERLLLWGTSGSARLAFSILRSQQSGRFTDAQIASINSASRALIAVLALHARSTIHRPNPVIALDCLEEIETCVATRLPFREAQVCARFLFGWSAPEIADCLHISAETVNTYRKRTYERLAINSRRELMLWYLAVWSKSRGFPAVEDARTDQMPQVIRAELRRGGLAGDTPHDRALPLSYETDSSSPERSKLPVSSAALRLAYSSAIPFELTCDDHLPGVPTSAPVESALPLRNSA
jgi:DNA-directed RNA polymerase specialized sigma24 family protein